METRTVTIRHCLVDLQSDREVELNGLRWHGFDGREQTIAVWSIINLRPCGHAAERDPLKIGALTSLLDVITKV